MDPFSLSDTNLNFSLSDLAQLIFYCIAIIYIVFTAVIHYHWKTYSTEISMIGLTFTIYAAVTLPLLILMAFIAFTI